MVNKRIRAIRDETSARLVWKESEPDVPVAGLLVGSVLATLQAKIVDVSSESAICPTFSSLIRECELLGFSSLIRECELFGFLVPKKSESASCLTFS